MHKTPSMKIGTPNTCMLTLLESTNHTLRRKYLMGIATIVTSRMRYVDQDCGQISNLIGPPIQTRRTKLACLYTQPIRTKDIWVTTRKQKLVKKVTQDHGKEWA